MKHLLSPLTKYFSTYQLSNDTKRKRQKRTMTGIFTRSNFSADGIPDLEGQVAVVTGGQSGIGKGSYQDRLEITAQLLLHGIKQVIIVARSEDKFNTAREDWSHRDGIICGEQDVRVQFVPCDLGDITDVRAAAEKIKKKTDRVRNYKILGYFDDEYPIQGLGVPYEYKLSPQGIDRVFATNCVGHQVLVTLLLPLLKAAVITANNGVRIVVTSSSLHSVCQGVDIDLLSSPSRVKWPALFDGVWRYGRSKLANILFSKELSRRLLQDSDPASKRIYVNSFFPGNIVTDQWASWDSYFGALIGSLIRVAGSFFGQTLEQGAATAIYLAASDDVSKNDFRGRYFIPVAMPCDPSPIGKNTTLGRDLWDWIDGQMTETLGLNWRTAILQKEPKAPAGLQGLAVDSA
ncbi:uncharacterized protein N7446_011061 [Penicillium canescens]|uniref:Uncharacterized protein n=1 Tax=Penicillium canescens TaxID=5083 RepID=A0AAD6NBE3_PENCN|nr:uncharacterized protein N7446_011061 [Penicillium canescens]KAJ6048020.1 hypothetical protein N7460_004167 [Penicillium canescens]KAJ6048378.1 hypothetical protein N7446_011061 [Penicillium canescens]